MRVSSLLILLALAAQSVQADEPEPPSMALLEYLGEWQDGDGNEIDPQALALLALEGESVGESKDDQE